MGNANTAVNLLCRARHAVALTGAGISTRSGIPDFRSPESGLWERYNPAEVASIYGFRHDPKRFYDWIRPLCQTVLEAQPNAAHIALARMEAMGKLEAVITQNIDMLHARAGSHVVYELHGHLREVTCIHCFTVYPAQAVISKFMESDEIPTCPACGHVLKPNVILFGEQLPAQALIGAQRAARQCDVMLVAGSSLEVYPAAELPVIARQNGASLIFVNLSDTPLDSLADVVLHDDVANVLPQIVHALKNESVS
jgi:NAD-dependent deacetylase